VVDTLPTGDGKHVTGSYSDSLTTATVQTTQRNDHDHRD
jgi:hypothetical protein